MSLQRVSFLLPVEHRLTPRIDRHRTCRLMLRSGSIEHFYGGLPPLFDRATAVDCVSGRENVRDRSSPTTRTQAKLTQMPLSATPVSSVAHVSPTDTENARVRVPVVTISPAASGGLT